MFIPIEGMATYFSQLLDQYPVSPYLDSRDSFIRWMHFIHNKINQRLEKPTITLSKFYEIYYIKSSQNIQNIVSSSIFQTVVFYYYCLPYHF
jgi:hypothetical protein